MTQQEINLMAQQVLMGYGFQMNLEAIEFLDGMRARIGATNGEVSLKELNELKAVIEAKNR